MTNHNNIQNLLQHMNSGFAYHKILLNKNGEPCDYVFLDINPAFERITGLKRKNIINEPASKVYGNSNNTHIKTYGKVALTGQPNEFILHTKESEKYYEIKAYSDKHLYFAVIFNDITVREQTKKALEESYLKYKVIADYNFDWEYWKGTDDSFEYVSPSVQRISGFTDQDFYENPKLFFDQIIEQDKQIWIDHESKTKQQICCDKPIVLRFKTKQGIIIWIEHICQPIYSKNNKFIGYRGTNRNVTEQKQLQQKILNAIIQTEETERKRIAQDLHDGLGPTLSTTKRYIESFFKSNNPEHKKQAEQLLINGINEASMQVSMISNSLSPHLLTDFGLETAIKNLLDKTSLIENIKYTLNFSVSTSLPKNIDTTLYRIASELVNNSAKYANCKNINIKIIEENSQLLFVYSDDGIGFDFEKIKQEKKGMGLFNICNRIQSLNGTFNFTQLKPSGIMYNIYFSLINFEL